jgi:hypothetical protein
MSVKTADAYVLSISNIGGDTYIISERYQSWARTIVTPSCYSLPVSAVNRHHFNADPDPIFHYETDADPDPNPSFTHVGKYVNNFFLLLFTEVSVYITLSFSSALQAS